MFESNPLCTADSRTGILTPNEAFDGLKPIELIECGEVDRFWRMIWELKNGMTF